MSVSYDLYLREHKDNVRKGFEWIRDNTPEVLKTGESYEHTICWAHDESKSQPDEYNAYDKYFYGGNRSYAVVREFREAWLKHIHRNPHHWQHWVLINDEPGEGMIILDMPHVYIVEMICDWWAFSWQKDNLYEIFDWYEKHSEHMKLSDKTRKTVEDILSKIRSRLEESVNE